MLELRDLIALLLTKEGHQVETVNDGSQALLRLEAAPEAFDLVITDHHMPELNGLEFMSRLRRLPYRGKVLVFSSELSEAVHQAYVDLKPDRILQKPVAPSALRKALAEIYGEVVPAGSL